MMLVLVISSLIALGSSIYIKMSSGAPRCFKESLSRESVMKFTFSSVASPDTKCSVSATGPKGVVALQETNLPVSQESNSLAFKSVKDGSHEICLRCSHSPTPSAWTLRFDRVGDWDYFDNGAGTVTKNEVQGTEGTLKAALSLAEGVMKEAGLQKREEDHIRATSEQTTSTVALFAGIQILLILLSSLLSARSLAKYIRISQMI
jgi:hypothetical protein